MAGGTSNKNSNLVMVALAKLADCEQALNHLNCMGIPPGDPRHAARFDPAVTACITALQALV